MKDVTRGQLALMVLPRSSLGGLPVKGWVERRAGFETNAESAATSLDPRLTRASLTTEGRLTGYALGYSVRRAKLEDALQRGSGPIGVATEVSLYRDTAGTAAEMTRAIRDSRTLIGKTIKGGAKLDHAATFPVAQVGDAAVGFKLRVGIDGVHVCFTQVNFRSGRLLARVVETRVDAKNVDPTVTALARELDGRINGILTN